MAATWSVLLLVTITPLFCFSVCGNHVDDPDLESRKFVEAGNVTISGLFPVHSGGCGLEHFRPNYMAMSQAMVYAIKRINSDPNLLPNITLGYEIYDYCLIDRLAMETALEVINRRKLALMYSKQEQCFSQNHGLGQIPAMIGSGTSGNSILVANLLQVQGIPLISYAATSDELSRKKTYPTFFRTVPPDRFQSQAMADIASRFNWTYIAAIAADNAYGRSGIDYLRRSVSNKGLCLAMENYFTVSDGNNTKAKVSRIITELKSFPHVRVVVLYCTYPQAQLLLEEARKQNLPKKTWIASEGWGDNQKILNPVTLPVAKGLIGVVYRNLMVDGFVQYLTDLTSIYKPVHWWKDFWESQFNCVFNPSGSKMNICSNNLRITREMYHNKMHTSMSAYVINAVYAIAHALDAMYQCKVPHEVLEGVKCYSKSITPVQLLRHLKAVNFTSPVSDVKFDSNGDPSGSYTIINLQQRNGSWEFRKIGSWEASRSRQLHIDEDKIMWNGDTKGKTPQSMCEDTCRPGYWQTRRIGCCWQCIKCPLDEISKTYGSSNCTKCPEDTISNSNHTQCLQVPRIHIGYSHTVGLCFIIFSCVGLVATICATLIFVRYNRSPVVKSSNRELSYMLLFCIAMCYIAPFIYLSEPTRVGCILEQIWFYLFYTTCIAILAAKTNKIVKLFEETVPRSKYASKLLKYRHVLFVFCVMFLELVIIIIWVSSDPPSPYINKSQREEYVDTCIPSKDRIGEACHYLLMSILILASLVCCYFAYKARKLPDNFNEGKFIVFSLYILIISWLTFYPVFLNIQDIYTVVVLCATTVVSASGLLFCMFWPKIYIIIWRPHKNTKQYIQEQISRHAFRVNTLDAATATRPMAPINPTATNTTL